MLDHNDLTRLECFSRMVGFEKSQIEITDYWLTDTDVEFEYTHKKHKEEMVTYVSFPISDFDLYCRDMELLRTTVEEFRFVPGQGAEIEEHEINVDIHQAWQDQLFSEKDLRGFLVAHLSYLTFTVDKAKYIDKLTPVARNCYVQMKIRNGKRKQDSSLQCQSDAGNSSKVEQKSSSSNGRARAARYA